MHRTTIRFQITALAAAAVIAVLVIASIALITVQRGRLTEVVDASLQQRADDLTVGLAAGGSTPDGFAGTAEEDFAQLLGGPSEVLASSPNLHGGAPLAIDYRAGDPQTIQTVSGLEIDDDVFRVLSRTVETPAGRGVLHVGRSFEVVTESTIALAGSLAISIPVVAALLATMVWWLVGRTLRPVEDIRAQVEAIRAGDLSRRVPEPPGGDEIARLARTMNEMLDRLQDSMERQQRFVADASHELRIPLTRMRTELEVDLSQTVNAADRTRLAGLRDEVKGLQLLVEDLLHLARADAHRASFQPRRVDLDDIVLREAGRLRANGRVVVDVAGVSAAQVHADPAQLARAVRNLCDNAERHAAGLVTLMLAESNRMAVLTVADDGPGIPVDRADTVFERFGRVDEARSRAIGGSGLGLAITREIVNRHGGTVELDVAHRPGARFVVRLPVAP